jgi:hypothetical protein
MARSQNSELVTKVTKKQSFPQTFSNRTLIGNFRGKSIKASLASQPLVRARQYVAKIPSSVTGQGGHEQTFKVALALTHGFCLDESDAWHILCEYNNRCEPPWSQKELRHKLVSAQNPTRHSKPRGYLLDSTIEPKLERPAPRIIGQVKLPEVSVTPQCAIEENVLSTPLSKESVAISVAISAQDIEAHRMAAELRKLHQLGIISGADDPDSRFFAKVIHQFHGTIQKQPQNAA